MASSPVTIQQYELLRERLARYETAFESVKDRLEAFSRLEQIARDHQTAPEIVAAKSAAALLERKLTGLIDEVEALTIQRDSTRGELQMLLLSKKQASADIELARGETDGAEGQTATALNELEAMREDARRLAQENLVLEKYIDGLRSEILKLENRYDEAKGQAGRRGSDDDPAICDIRVESSPSRRADDDPAESENLEESEAFDRFFNASVEDDKARDWILR